MIFFSFALVLLVTTFLLIIGGTYLSYKNNLSIVPDNALKKMEVDIIENSSIISNLEEIFFFDSQKDIEIEKGCEFIIKGDNKVYLMTIEIHEKDNNWIFNYKSHDLLIDKRLRSCLRKYKYQLNTFFGLSLPLRVVQITTLIALILVIITGFILTGWSLYIIGFSWW